MAKLTDPQLIILNAAAQRDDLGVATIDKAPATRSAIEALLKGKYLTLVPMTADLALWERTEEGSFALAATAKTLKLLGIEESAPPAPASVAPKPARASRKTPPPAEATPAPEPAPAGKLGEIAKLLRRAKGATLAELMKATGWQVHSVRGAMSGGLKKRCGLAITSEKRGDTRFYRIASAD
jgi:hypothetical protein